MGAARPTAALLVAICALCATIQVLQWEGAPRSNEAVALTMEGEMHRAAVVERSCFQRDCVWANGQKSCRTVRASCHPIQRPRTSSFGSFGSSIFHEFDHPMNDVERMGGFGAFRVLRGASFPELHINQLRAFPRIDPTWGDMAFLGGRKKLKITKAAPPSKKVLKVNMKVNMPKKQQERIAKFQKKAVAARVAWIKQLRKKMVAAKKARAMQKMQPKSKCVEKQCVSNGGPMQCHVVAFPCTQPGGGKHFQALRRMLKGMHGGAHHHQHQHHVKVVRIVPGRPAKALAKVLRKIVIHAMKAKLKRVIRRAGHNPNGRKAKRFFRKLHHHMAKQFAKSKKKAAAARAAQTKTLKKVLKKVAAAQKKKPKKQAKKKAKKPKKKKAKKKVAAMNAISDRVENRVGVYHVAGERIIGDGPGLHNELRSNKKPGQFVTDTALFGELDDNMLQLSH